MKSPRSNTFAPVPNQQSYRDVLRFEQVCYHQKVSSSH
jgi:hypothetical protein